MPTDPPRPGEVGRSIGNPRRAGDLFGVRPLAQFRWGLRSWLRKALSAVALQPGGLMRIGDHRRIRRRRVLQAGAWLIAACCFGMVPVRSVIPKEDDSTRLAQALSSMFGDPDAVRTIGTLYLHRHPDEATRGRLQEHLFGPGRPALPRSVARWLADRQSLDLAREDLTIIAGWVLTRSEARLCGLATVLAAP